VSWLPGPRAIPGVSWHSWRPTIRGFLSRLFYLVLLHAIKMYASVVTAVHTSNTVGPLKPPGSCTIASVKLSAPSRSRVVGVSVRPCATYEYIIYRSSLFFVLLIHMSPYDITGASGTSSTTWYVLVIVIVLIVATCLLVLDSFSSSILSCRPFIMWCSRLKAK